MREWEISYIGWKDLPRELDGTEHKWPSKCHHAHYVAGISVREVTDKTNLNDDNVGFISRCPFCGEPDYKTHPVGGSMKTMCCNQTESSCCPGASDGQSG